MLQIYDGVLSLFRVYHVSTRTSTEYVINVYGCFSLADHAPQNDLSDSEKDKDATTRKLRFISNRVGLHFIDFVIISGEETILSYEEVKQKRGESSTIYM